MTFNVSCSIYFLRRKVFITWKLLVLHNKALGERSSSLLSSVSVGIWIGPRKPGRQYTWVGMSLVGLGKDRMVSRICRGQVLCVVD